MFLSDALCTQGFHIGLFLLQRLEMSYCWDLKLQYCITVPRTLSKKDNDTI